MNENSIMGFEERCEIASLSGAAENGLERLCKISGDGIRSAPTEAGIERIEANFQGNGFSPHRHDTYAIGLTLHGVQRFKYRGSERASCPGQVIVIHPDEVHDGGAGTETGLRYRMMYIPPEMIAQALGRRTLPHVCSPVLTDPVFRKSLIEALQDLEAEMGDLRVFDSLAELAACLNRFSDDARPMGRALDWPVLKLCADFLREHAADPIGSADLEAVSGLDRFSLSRQFRAAFGTSPHRYLVMRRLERVKIGLADGECLAGAATANGFADQSHMSRHFKQAFGMSPGKWRQLNAAIA
ncbi:AraC family transcriptional regulator [Roseibium denhamense]|nr:AraC family transcriptional regulator [Roseibium denhamense]